MNRFTIEQLATLLAVIDVGSFELAARQLRITPSAVSQRIKAMEQSAGRVLVQRTTPAATTEAGQVVLRLARQVELLDADATALLNGNGNGNGDAGTGTGIGTGTAVRVSLAINADSLATWFLDAISVLSTRDISFDLHREDQQNTTSLLRSGEVMAAVTSTGETVQGCSSEYLGAMRYRAVATSAFIERWMPGGLARDVPPDLPDLPVVTFDRDDHLQEEFLRVHTGRGSTRPSHYVPASSDFARAVLLGFGWALLPEQQCLAEIESGQLRQLAPKHPVDVALYWQRWNLASPLLDAVSNAVRSSAAAELHQLARPTRSVRTTSVRTTSVRTPG